MNKALALLVCCLGSSALAAEDGALQRCRELRDSAARLSCYDAIPLSAAAGSQATTPGAAPVTPSAAFGLESRPAPTTGPALIASIESAIDGLFEGWLPGSQIKLSNGQVWQVTDGSQAAYRLNSPRVRVTRGVSGSFFMTIDGVAQTPRVRRVN